MAEEKKCATCGEPMRKGNPLYINCPKHRTQEETRAAWAESKRRTEGRTAATPRAPRADADDSVLDRIDTSPRKPPPPSRKVKKAEPAGDVEEFFRLAEALGLEPQEMLDGWCRDWVSKTRAKALAPTLIGEVNGTELVSAEAAGD